MLIQTVFLVGALLFPQVAVASSTPIDKTEWNRQEINLYISHFSREYKVNESRVYNTIKCESGFRYDVAGDGGHSWGLSQIHLPSHPDITKEQATNPLFAVEFITKEFSEGRERKWTCWRTLFNIPS